MVEATPEAMELFWEHGYEATSMAMLTKRLGIGRASLYATFGDKHELYLRALRCYLETRDPNPLELLSQPGPALPAVRTLVEGYVQESLADEAHRGCLIVNAATERAPHEPSVARLVESSWTTLEAARPRPGRMAGRVVWSAPRHLRRRSGEAEMTALVIGESLVDEVALPDGGVRRTPGGSPLNIAVGLARLEVPTTLLTHLGTDPDGRTLVEHLTASNVRLLAPPQGTTSVAHASLDRDGSATYRFDLRWDPDPDRDLIPDDRWRAVHVGSLGAFLEPGARVVTRFLDHCPTAVRTFDPNIRPGLLGAVDAARHRFESLAARVDAVKLSIEDAAWLYPDRRDPADVVDHLLGLGPSFVAVTLGRSGSLLATAAHRRTVPAAHVEMVDTIGAGDAYTAAMIMGLLEAAPDAGRKGAPSAGAVGRIARVATEAAAHVVARAGADPPTRAELAARLPGIPGPG